VHSESTYTVHVHATMPAYHILCQPKNYLNSIGHCIEAKRLLTKPELTDTARDY